MEPTDQAPMRKEAIVKEDGRYLIYYRFESTPDGRAATDETAEAK